MTVSIVIIRLRRLALSIESLFFGLFLLHYNIEVGVSEKFAQIER